MTIESAPPAPLPRERLSERVAGEIRRAIVKGDYPAGARLPSGAELATRFGVTRLTVREAIAQLEATGLVRTRHGAGTFVVDPVETATLSLLSETLAAGRELTPAEIKNLLEFRAVVLLGFVDAIVRGASTDDVARLEAIVARERSALGDEEALALLDYELNEALAVASKNLFYTLLIRSVKRAHLHLGGIVFHACGDGSVVVDTHAAIVRALGKGHAAAVRRTLVTYVEGGNAIVAEHLARTERRRHR